MSRGKGKLIFFDKMILYGHEGLKKYSSNEIPKSALGKNHPSVQCTIYSNVVLLSLLGEP